MESDGALIRYRHTVEPWLSLLRYRRDNRRWRVDSKAGLARELGPGLLGNGFTDVTSQLPDARWAAPGDIIVYEKKGNPSAAGHIDIRTYDGYISDFIADYLPVRGFNVIGIYRKYFDPLPELRMRAFLEVLASRETKGIPIEKSWYALNTPINGSKFAESIDKHPWLGLAKKGDSTASGRYQATLPGWKEAIKLYGLPDSFLPADQTRLAVIKMELPYRHGALGLVRRGEIEDAVKVLTDEWAALPGTNQDQGYTMSQLLVDFDIKMKEVSK